MCGISGLITNKPIKHSVIKKMDFTVKHRGPDDGGFLIVGSHDADTDLPKLQIIQSNSKLNIALGHTRLAILDLSERGRQPMRYMERYWIVFNGEIYNFIELRKELETEGYAFATNTDTEVIMAAYDLWRRECLRKLNGMFAFILFDSLEGKLFVARDRFGIKPLYFWISPDGFLAFASEIKQFTVLSGWRARMNHQRVYDFLNWALVDHTNETLFDGVYQLRGGEACELDTTDLAQRFESGIVTKNLLPVYSWYDLKPRKFHGTFEEAAEEFQGLIRSSVLMHLRADVPVGSCLSGGLDSSSIVGLMIEILNKQNAKELLKTFSYSSGVTGVDEKEFIEILANYYNIDSHYTYASNEKLFEVLDDLVWFQDEPFCSTSIYAQWNVFKLSAENGVKVLLDGQGGDELLCGYGWFFIVLYAELLKKFQLITLWREIRMGKELHSYNCLFVLRNMANVFLPRAIRRKLKNWFGTESLTPRWMNLGILNAKPTDMNLETNIITTSIKELSISQLTASNLPMLLHWEDRNSMAHSVESRVPFLDYRLVEFVLGVPSEYIISEGITKRLLRAGMRDILPTAILMRMDKIGFETPEQLWVRENSDKFMQVLRESIEVSNGIINPSALEGLGRILQGQEPYSSLVWRLICFGSWVKKYVVML